jgi:hypothetical protein
MTLRPSFHWSFTGHTNSVGASNMFEAVVSCFSF